MTFTDLILCPNPLVTNSQRTVSISLCSVKKILQYLLSKTKCYEMSVHFVGKKRISLLHEQYFDDPSATDCITLCYDDPYFLGEVFVCPEIAREYAQKENISLHEELTLYVVHGFLHLIGFRDYPANERKKMQTEEKKWMTKLAKNHLRITP